MTITLLYQGSDPKDTLPNVTRNTCCFCRYRSITTISWQIFV